MIRAFLTILVKLIVNFYILFFGWLVLADEAAAEFKTKVDLNSSLDSIFAADRLKKQGRVSAAGKIYQAILYNPNTNALIKQLAANRVKDTYNSQSIYKRSVSLHPFRSKRNFKSDVIHLEINGSKIPFVLNRTQPRHKYLRFEHSLSAWLWYHYPKSLVDEFRVTHDLSLFDNGNISNNIRASFFTNEISIINLAELFIATEIDSSTNYEQYTLGLEAIAGFNDYQFGFASDKTFFSNDELGFEAQIISKLSLEKPFKEYVVSAEHRTSRFSNKTFNFTTNSLNISRTLEGYFSSVSLDYSNRTDKEIQFPYQKLRQDNVVTVSVDKLTNLFGKKNQVKLAAAFNDSSLDTYSYNELQIDFQFIF